MVAFIFLWLFIVLRVIKNFDVLSNYFMAVSLILLVFPLYSLFGFYYQRIGKDAQVREFLQDSWDQYGVTAAEEKIIQPEVQPDIYYIIFDSYARTDALAELYNYDNSSFEEALENRGFYVAKQSRSNYAHTAFSLSSSMNMIHINSLPEYVTQGFTINKEWLINEASIDTLQSNRIMEILRQQNYQIVSFDTGFESINFPDANYSMVPPTVDQSNAFLAEPVANHLNFVGIYFGALVFS